MRNMGLGLSRDMQTGGPPGDTPMVDTAEQVYISSLSLLKMSETWSSRCAHGSDGVSAQLHSKTCLSFSSRLD